MCAPGAPARIPAPMAQKSTSEGQQVLATNRKALHEYEILDKWEAGIVLQGT